MSKPGRTWIPLDANFTRDPDVLEAGEGAGWLYLAVLGQLKLAGRSAGIITRAEVRRLGIDKADSKLAALNRVGLVVEIADRPGVYDVPAWSQWNDPSTTRAAYMRDWRSRRKSRENDDDL